MEEIKKMFKTKEVKNLLAVKGGGDDDVIDKRSMKKTRKN